MVNLPPLGEKTDLSLGASLYAINTLTITSRNGEDDIRLDIHYKGNSLSNFYYSSSLSLSLYIIPLLTPDLTVGGVFLRKNPR